MTQFSGKFSLNHEAKIFSKTFFLQFIMRNILFIILFIFFIRSYAANWEKVGIVERNSYYVDIDNIKKKNGIVVYWNLIDYFKPTKAGANSDIGKYKVDCINKKQTWLFNAFYSLPMAKGNTINEANPVWNYYGSTLNEIRYLTPGSIEEKIMKFACDRAK